MGAFSSGTTAVTGMVMRLGALSLAPLNETNDPRTPSSLESIAFKALCDSLVCEDTLEFREDKRNQAIPMLLGFKQKVTEAFFLNESFSGKSVVLKVPTSALFLREIETVFNPEFIFVYRDPEEIEKTKVRRGWGDSHGKVGACILHAHMRYFQNTSIKPNITTSFEDVRHEPRKFAEMINRKLQLNATEQMLQAASDWIIDHGIRYPFVITREDTHLDLT